MAAPDWLFGMASVNKVILIGNLGRDPEVRYSPAGLAVCNFSLATTRYWTDKRAGERMEETEWHRVVAYDKQAEVIGEFSKKGSPIYVEGRLKTRKWEDKQGIERYTTEIVMESFQLLGSKPKDGTAPADEQGSPAPADAKPRPRAAAPAAATPSGGGFEDMDDDSIPF